MKPLGYTQRRLLLLVALSHRQRGIAPTWGELQAATGLPRWELARRLLTLRRSSLVTFVDEQPRSIHVTARGVAAAVGRDGGRAA